MKKFFILGIFTLTTAACGGTPTEPTAPPQTIVSEVTTVGPQEPASDPVVTPPVPTPAPAPAPLPEPAPSPVPPVPVPAPKVTTFAAVVDASYWYGQPLFGATFTVKRFPTEIIIGETHIPLVFESTSQFVAGINAGISGQFTGRWMGGDNWSFEYSGRDGYAVGHMTVQ